MTCIPTSAQFVVREQDTLKIFVFIRWHNIGRLNNSCHMNELSYYITKKTLHL